MKLLYARNLFLPADFGGNAYPYEVVTRLSRRGHDVTVLAAGTPRFRSADIPGVRLITYPVSNASPLLTHLSHVLASQPAMRRALATDPDVVISSSYDFGFGWVLTHGRSHPTVFIYHSEFFSDAVRATAARGGGVGALGRILLAYVQFAQLLVLRQANIVVAVSDFSRQQILASAPQADVRLITTGVDTKRFAPAADQEALRRELSLPLDRPNLVAVGRLAPVKGFDALVEAARLLNERTPIHLTIIGDGPERERLSAQARDAGLDQVIRFTGYLTPPDVSRYMQAANVQVCSSLFENYSQAILQALSCGTPVAGTPRGGTPEILRQVDPQLIFDDVTPEAMASKLEQLLADSDSLSRAGRRGRDLAVRCYDWGAVVDRLEAVFREAAR